MVVTRGAGGEREVWGSEFWCLGHSTGMTVNNLLYTSKYLRGFLNVLIRNETYEVIAKDVSPICSIHYVHMYQNYTVTCTIIGQIKT